MPRSTAAPRLGAHMSIAGGMPRAVERARAVDATALQVFVKSSNQWRSRPFADGEVEAFRRAVAAAGLERHTVAHAGYLINLASPDDALWERSRASFREEVERCDALGIRFLVVHPGSHVGSGEQAGLDRVVAALDATLAPRSRATVLLETTAGQGSNLGHRFEHLGYLLDRARVRKRLGVCVDTCHVFAAGYEMRNRRGYAATFEALDDAVGLDRVLAFHLNDSKGDLGSRKDRHAHIGEGALGLEPFRLLLRDRRFRDRPMVLETPKGEDLEEDRVNLDVLRGLVRR